MLTLITVCHLEERLTIVDGELRNGRAGAKNFPVAPDVVAVDLGENPPVLQPPIKRLVTRPDVPLHLEVLGGVGVVLGALQPSSASTRSPGSRKCARTEVKILMSGHLPAG